MSPDSTPSSSSTHPPRSVTTAYALWIVGFFSPVSGLHRFYLGKWRTGALWALTWGLFRVGQVIDLFLIPQMVEDYNRQQALLEAGSPEPKHPPLKGEALMREIMRLARERQGILTVNEAILEIPNAGFDAIEQAFRELVRRDYAYPENHVITGAVEYHFTQLQGRDPQQTDPVLSNGSKH